jgi:hypothetical protein
MLFVSLIAVGLLRLELLRSRDKAGWVGVYAGMMQISLIAFATGGLLLDLAFFDLLYQLVALTVSLELAAVAVKRAETGEPAASEVERPADEWWRQPRPAASGGAR